MPTQFHVRPIGTGIAIGATALAVSTTAAASGFALLEQSASRLGTAFAGTAAAADDATTIFYNPAGLVHLDQGEVLIVASAVDVSSKFRNENSLPALGQPLGDAGSDAGGWNAVAAAYLAFPVNHDLAFGLVAWTGWSSVQELRIVRDSGVVLSVTPEHWEDTWRYALGATYKLGDAWKLRGGVAFDETPVPSSTRTARLPDAERKWVALGAQWAPENSPLLIDFGYAHLFSDDVRINQNDGNTAVSGLLNGQQESAVNIVSLQFGYRF